MRWKKWSNRRRQNVPCGTPHTARKTRKRVLHLAVLGLGLMVPMVPGSVRAADFARELAGARGYGVIRLDLREKASESGRPVGRIPEGEPFTILAVRGEWWKVSYQKEEGYVRQDRCMINLPDVEPEILYEITNASSSIYQSSGKKIDQVSGKKLYTVGKVFNRRLDRKEYIVPILYSTAEKIARAQRYAEADGYTLKIYDGYRPRSVTKLLSRQLSQLYRKDSQVRKYIDYNYVWQKGKEVRKNHWGQGWFLAQNVSSHNCGAAIDVTLADRKSGKELDMPSAMHELSTRAIKYSSPSSARSPRNYAPTMNANARRLDHYFTKAGMQTLASEWWHFQEEAGRTRVKKLTGGKGCDFQVQDMIQFRFSDEKPALAYDGK